MMHDSDEASVPAPDCEFTLSAQSLGIEFSNLMPGKKQLWMSNPPRFVAIVGGSGAGKSWLAERLVTALGKDAARISLDDFYKDRSHLAEQQRAKINFDHPRSIDWPLVEQVIFCCRQGKPASLPQYDFASHTRQPGSVVFKPKPIIIFEGLWLLRRPSVRRWFDLKIFVECPQDVRLNRRLRRDCAERCRSVDSVQSQFLTTVAPMHDTFVEPQRRWADVIFNHQSSGEQLSQVAEGLRTLLK